MLRAAVAGDLDSIHALLEAAGLPIEGVRAHLASFVAFESAGRVVGVGGLEVYADVALLRSLAVAPAFRRRGVAGAICERLETDAARDGVGEFYLLTETAESFFAKRGFGAVPRSAAPPAIAATEEFAELYPDSAVLMRRRSAR